MYDELVKRLRRIAVNERSESFCQDVMQAADAIEKLQKRVPKAPHGRLIDADALKKKRHWTDDFYETEYVEVEDIDAAPTVLEAEEGE